MRRLIAAVVILAGLAATTTACSSTAVRMGVISLSPADIVRRSVAAMDAMPYHIRVEEPVLDSTLEADMDPVHRLVDQVSNPDRPDDPLHSLTRVIDDDVYMWPISGTWVHLRLSRTRALSPLRRVFKVGLAHDFLLGTVSAIEPVPGTFTGVSEFSKMGGVIGLGLRYLSPDGTRGLSFEARLDDQGRLVYLKYTIPSSDATPPIVYTFTVSNYGQAFTVQPPPAADVTEAAEQMYATY